MSELAQAIIQSPTAARMLWMVTEGFYDQSRTALWLFEAIGREYDDMDMWSTDLRYEAFPQTCTWSIYIWEFIYEIEPDDSLTLEQRRAQVMTRRLSHPPINPARIEAILSALIGRPVAVTENVAPYTFAVDVDEDGTSLFDHSVALRKLRQIKPSHLSFQYQTKVTEVHDITTYSAVVESTLIKEYHICDNEPLPADTTDYSGVAVSEFIKEGFVA